MTPETHGQPDHRPEHIIALRSSSDRRNRRVTPAEFRQRVRKYPRDELLQAVARKTAELLLERVSLSDVDAQWSAVQESYLFQIAGICVTNCNNHRNAAVDERTLNDLIDEFFDVWETDLLGGPHDDEVWRSIMSRFAFLQAPFQQALWEPVIRALCLFGDDPRFGPPVLDERRCEEMLGATLPRFLMNGFAMFTAALNLRGGATRPVLRDHLEALGADGALQVIESWFARPVDDLVRLGRLHTPSPDELWRYNPFFEWPVAILNDSSFVAVSPLAVLQRLSPQGLYFVALRAIDPDTNKREFRAFTKALGGRFERYVGEQLKSIQHATLHSEITYDSSNKSVDFIIETPQVVVLVEVKSVAPSIDTRSGVFPDEGDVQRSIQRACNQISRTAELIRAGHTSFASLQNRQMRGLVVTREQYFNLPLPYVTDVVEPASIPTTIVSSQQLESAIPALSDDADCGTSLLGALAPDQDVVKTSLNPLPLGRNRLLEEIGDRLRDEFRLIEPDRTRHE